MESRLHGNSEVFPCSECGKIFDKKKPQIRHSSYCRKRARYPPRPRKRSCAVCTKAKSHCDGVFPTCSRCAKRESACIYQHRPVKRDRPGKSPGTEIPSFDEEWQLATSLPLETRNTDFCDPEAFNPINDDLFSSEGQFDNESLPFISDSYHDGEILCTDSLYHDQEIRPLLSHEFQTGCANLRSFPPLVNQPILQAPRAFKPRTVRCRKLSLNKKFVMCTLQSYPQMLHPGQGPHPFLHPGQKDLPGPLATCSGIVALWSVKNKNNSAFIWKSIHTEQVRLSEECHTFDDRDIVASLQAISIYFILRVSEPDENYTSFDIPLISTMLKLAIRVREVSLNYSKPSFSFPATWEEWIIAESLQRAIFVIFIVDFLFDLSAGTVAGSCDGAKHLLQMRLPCSKKLWNFKTRSEWEQERAIQTMLMQLGSNEHPKFLDLMKYSVNATACDASLDRWISDIDEFGLLVLSATSIADDVGFIVDL